MFVTGMNHVSIFFYVIARASHLSCKGHTSETEHNHVVNDNNLFYSINSNNSARSPMYACVRIHVHILVKLQAIEELRCIIHYYVSEFP